MRFIELEINTSKLESQVEFYSQVLKLPISYSDKTKVTFVVGNSKLTFVQTKASTPYHFAINIPSNKAIEALDWIKSNDQLELLKDGDIELQDFDFWNAEAVYFYDPDHNIVEFIARKNMKIIESESFTTKQLLGISEIGVPTTAMIETCDYLNKQLAVPTFSGDPERFCAVGFETGLFICVDPNKKDWFPTNDKVYFSKFKLAFEMQGKTHHLNYSNGKLLEI